ncbi:MAG: hypothetical protein IJR04_01930 [Bacteroidales bacterium]|nr:hypothetical protein [Bacteroidales bacterium]
MNYKEEQIFSRLAHVIEEGNVGFFFGAGTSRNAGVPVVSTIVSKIVSSLALPEYYAKIILELKYPFEAFLEILSRYISIKDSLKVFNLGEPTEFHLLVKFLVEKGLVKQLMTTNFDLLIEKTKIPDLNVEYKENRFRQLAADKVNYIKVHGGVQDVKTIRTLMGTIAKKQIRSKRKYAVDFFFNKAGLKTVFVFGYSCSDRLDLTPYIKSAANSDTRIIFVNHTQSEVIKEIQMNKDNPFFGFKSSCIECNTDSLICYLAGYFQAPVSCNHTSYSIDEYFDYSSLAMYEKCLFGAGLLFRNGNLEDAASLLRYALQHEGDHVQRVEIFSLLLEVYHNIQTNESKPMEEILPEGVTFEMVKEWKEKALNVLETINDDKERLNRIAGLKTHWGHFLLSYRRYDEALQSYQESLELLLQTSNTYRKYQCYNNFANTVFVRWKNGESVLEDDEVYQECHKKWRKCLRYFRQSEYPFEYEISCDNIAELLLSLRKNQKKRINDYLKTAKDLSEYLNDRTGVENCEEMMKKANCQ